VANAPWAGLGKANSFDCLIVDEAHRLNEKSGMFSHLGENQVKEIINASKLSVFFIDEDQKVTLKDIGDKEEIIRWAKEMKATVSTLNLESQFRCNGSNGYLAWLDNTLQIRPTANEVLDSAEYDFRIVDTPEKLHELNHYHLLLETPRGNLSHILQYLNGSYTTYFNVKRKRSGHLFHGRFTAILVEAEAYAIELSRYIHRNPVRARLVERPEEYEWSSYRYYLGLAEKPHWLKTDLVLSSFGLGGDVARYREFVDAHGDDDLCSPLENTVAATLLGTESFTAGISQTVARIYKPDRSLPAVRYLVPHLTMDEIVDTVERIIPAPSAHRLKRRVCLYFCHRHGGMSLKSIGERFGIGDSAVSLASKRVHEEAETNKALQEILGLVAQALGSK
jgi:putative transposase